MRSTFMGLEASKRGLYTQQSALYTTGHNISNANTQGYTRQRVNMETTPGFPGSGLNTGKTAGHIGTGVQAHSVQRIRDEFVDRQYRQETNKLGYWQSTTKSISQMEDIMAEPSEFGINQAFTDFWESMEDIIADPQDTAARQVMISKGQSLAESFNYMDTQLKQIQGNIGNEINVVTKEANSLLKQIADINKQIQTVEPNGYMPNDLYDARDVLLDRLNDIIPVSISYEKSGGNALDIAEGSMTVTFKDKNGNSINLVRGKEYGELSAVGSEPLVDENNGAVLDAAKNPAYKKIDGDVDDTNSGKFEIFKKIVVIGADLSTNINPDYDEKDSTKGKEFLPKTMEIHHNELESSKGKLTALIDAYGYEDAAGNEKGIYPEMLQKLDELVNVFVTEFNKIHKGGMGLDGTTGVNFFTPDGILPSDPNNINSVTARNIKINPDIKPENIAVQGNDDGTPMNAGSSVETGNNKNMLALAALQSKTQQNLQGGTFQSFYKSLIGELGVKGKQAATLEFNSITLQLQIENNRASHNSVSLDEEMTNMITFQQAYNANARMITVIDETLDKIINGMGRAGL